MPSEPDHTLGFLIGPCVRLLRERVPVFLRSSAPPSPFLSPWGEEGGLGEGEGRQACAAIQRHHGAVVVEP